MPHQMTIFEFMQQEADFVTMPEEKVIEIIGKRIGLKFSYDSYTGEYTATIGKMRLSVGISTYKVTHEGSQTMIAGHKFIGAGWGNHTEGGGRPCDSINETVEYLQKAIQRGKHEKLIPGGKRAVRGLPGTEAGMPCEL